MTNVCSEDLRTRAISMTRDVQTVRCANRALLTTMKRAVCNEGKSLNNAFKQVLVCKTLQCFFYLELGCCRLFLGHVVG